MGLVVGQLAEGVERPGMMDKAFPFYERLGVKGVKGDFMDRNDQEYFLFAYADDEAAASDPQRLSFSFRPVSRATP